MDPRETFQRQYDHLESRMRALAEADDRIFVPSPAPPCPVDYILICMEPSLGGRSPEAARARLDRGARNFVNSFEDFLLHYAVRQYLCRPGERYFITDVSKGAMAVKEAPEDREARYQRWFPLLMQEVGLVAAPGARLFSVGAEVQTYLEARHLGLPVDQILHYSGQAAAHRQAAVDQHPEDFASFRTGVSKADVVTLAAAILEASGIPLAMQDDILSDLHATDLTPSRKKLLFTYKMAFEQITGDGS